MKLSQNEIFHIYNRGNQQQRIFLEERNYIYFIEKIRTHLLPVCDLLAYCLMPNHFHLLIKADHRTVARQGPQGMQAFSKALRTMLSSYTRGLQQQAHFSGSLFRARTKAKRVSGNLVEGEDYVLSCFKYILANPVKAGLVQHPADWPFSSYRELVGLNHFGICNNKLIKQELALDINTLDDILGLPLTVKQRDNNF